MNLHNDLPGEMLDEFAVIDTWTEDEVNYQENLSEESRRPTQGHRKPTEGEIDEFIETLKSVNSSDGISEKEKASRGRERKSRFSNVSEGGKRYFDEQIKYRNLGRSNHGRYRRYDSFTEGHDKSRPQSAKCQSNVYYDGGSITKTIRVSDSEDRILTNHQDTIDSNLSQAPNRFVYIPKKGGYPEKTPVFDSYQEINPSIQNYPGSQLEVTERDIAHDVDFRVDIDDDLKLPLSKDEDLRFTLSNKKFYSGKQRPDRSLRKRKSRSRSRENLSKQSRSSRQSSRSKSPSMGSFEKSGAEEFCKKWENKIIQYPLRKLKSKSPTPERHRGRRRSKNRDRYSNQFRDETEPFRFENIDRVLSSQRQVQPQVETHYSIPMGMKSHDIVYSYKGDTDFRQLPMSPGLSDSGRRSDLMCSSPDVLAPPPPELSERVRNSRGESSDRYYEKRVSRSLRRSPSIPPPPPPPKLTDSPDEDDDFIPLQLSVRKRRAETEMNERRPEQSEKKSKMDENLKMLLSDSSKRLSSLLEEAIQPDKKSGDHNINNEIISRCEEKINLLYHKRISKIGCFIPDLLPLNMRKYWSPVYFWNYCSLKYNRPTEPKIWKQYDIVESKTSPEQAQSKTSYGQPETYRIETHLRKSINHTENVDPPYTSNVECTKVDFQYDYSNCAQQNIFPIPHHNFNEGSYFGNESMHQSCMDPNIYQSANSEYWPNTAENYSYLQNFSYPDMNNYSLQGNPISSEISNYSLSGGSHYSVPNIPTSSDSTIFSTDNLNEYKHQLTPSSYFQNNSMNNFQDAFPNKNSKDNKSKKEKVNPSRKILRDNLTTIPLTETSDLTAKENDEKMLMIEQETSQKRKKEEHNFEIKISPKPNKKNKRSKHESTQKAEYGSTRKVENKSSLKTEYQSNEKSGREYDENIKTHLNKKSEYKHSEKTEHGPKEETEGRPTEMAECQPKEETEFKTKENTECQTKEKSEGQPKEKKGQPNEKKGQSKEKAECQPKEKKEGQSNEKKGQSKEKAECQPKEKKEGQSKEKAECQPKEKKEGQSKEKEECQPKEKSKQSQNASHDLIQKVEQQPNQKAECREIKQQPSNQEVEQRKLNQKEDPDSKMDHHANQTMDCQSSKTIEQKPNQQNTEQTSDLKMDLELNQNVVQQINQPVSNSNQLILENLRKPINFSSDIQSPSLINVCLSRKRKRQVINLTELLPKLRQLQYSTYLKQVFDTISIGSSHPDYYLNDGLVCKTIDGLGKIVIPENKISELIEILHCLRSGHTSAKKICLTIATFFTPFKDVRTAVQRVYEKCKRCSTKPGPNHQHSFTKFSEPNKSSHCVEVIDLEKPLKDDLMKTNAKRNISVGNIGSEKSVSMDGNKTNSSPLNACPIAIEEPQKSERNTFPGREKNLIKLNLNKNKISGSVNQPNVEIDLTSDKDDVSPPNKTCSKILGNSLIIQNPNQNNSSVSNKEASCPKKLSNFKNDNSQITPDLSKTSFKRNCSETFEVIDLVDSDEISSPQIQGEISAFQIKPEGSCSIQIRPSTNEVEPPKREKKESLLNTEKQQDLSVVQCLQPSTTETIPKVNINLENTHVESSKTSSNNDLSNLSSSQNNPKMEGSCTNRVNSVLPDTCLNESSSSTGNKNIEQEEEKANSANSKSSSSQTATLGKLLMTKVREIQSVNKEVMEKIKALKAGDKEINKTYLFRGNMLCRKYNINGNDELKIVVPVDSVETFISLVHSVSGTHASLSRTITTMQKFFSPVPDLEKHVSSYISKCEKCSKKS